MLLKPLNIPHIYHERQALCGLNITKSRRGYAVLPLRRTQG